MLKQLVLDGVVVDKAGLATGRLQPKEFDGRGREGFRPQSAPVRKATWREPEAEGGGRRGQKDARELERRREAQVGEAALSCSTIIDGHPLRSYVK